MDIKSIIGKIFILALLIAGVLLTDAFAKNESGTSSTNRWLAPPTAKSISNPLTVTPEVVKAGKKIFAQQCVVCHGQSGKGDGPTAQFLGKKVANLTSPQVQSQTDGELFWKISNGNAPMPGFKTILSDEQRWQVITYIRQLASK